MCGIAGIYRSGGIASEAMAKGMAQVLTHRGPDDAGVWAEGRIALAHRRLSVLDLSPSGHQPMPFPERGLMISYNGEIYNYLDLRTELQKRGYTFFSNTDTEVILKGYDAWGEAIFTKLRGMFALAIWDRRNEELILARDPHGIKPLYYARCGEDFIFGSELKSLRVHPDVPTGIDQNSLFFYLRHLYVPEPRSIYERVSRLPAGHLLRVKGNDYKLFRFHNPPERVSNTHQSYQDTLAELQSVLKESVKAHLISDVPLGVFLSGGVDSSAIVAFMHSAGISKIKTFTIGFEGLPAYDERRFAHRIAEQYQTDHHEILVHPDIAGFVRDGLITTFDEPFANPAALIADELSAFARQEVTVALSGLGGDEFFAGYPRYNGMLWLKHFMQLPGVIHRIVGGTLKLMPPSPDRASFLERLRRFVDGSRQPPEACYDNLMSYISDEAAKQLLSPDVVSKLNEDAYLPNFTKTDGDLLDALLALDQSTYMPGDLLTYSDRTAMRHSLEVRVPFCDIVVADFACSIPSKYKIHYGQLKSVLRDSIKSLVPSEVLYRKKGGFRVPINEWLHGELRPLVDEVLSQEQAEKIPFLNGASVKKVIKDFYGGEHQYGFVLWALLILSAWFEKSKG
jgi:asparagine synthase (glutamine-hydrolysing)